MLVLEVLKCICITFPVKRFYAVILLSISVSVAYSSQVVQ